MINSRLSMVVQNSGAESGRAQICSQSGLYKKFKATLGYRVRPCLAINSKTTVEGNKLFQTTHLGTFVLLTLLSQWPNN